MNTTIKPNCLYWASFNRFEVRVSGQAVLDIARPGPNDAAVADHLQLFISQIEMDNFPNKPTAQTIRAELADYGAWTKEELVSDLDNLSRLLWIACHNIAEEDSPDCSKPVKSA